MLRLPHFVRRLGAGKTGQLHNAADDEHEVFRGVAVQDDLAARQLAPMSCLKGARRVRTVRRQVAHGWTFRRWSGEERRSREITGLHWHYKGALFALEVFRQRSHLGSSFPFRK